MRFAALAQRRRRRGTSAVVNTNPVATVVVSLADTTLDEGSTAQAFAVLRDAEGAVLSGRTKVWTSSDEAIATVNATGFITAVAEGGPVNITCTAEGQSDSVAVTVEDNAVATIALTPATLDLAAPSAPEGDGTEPTYNAGTDTLLLSESFDGYATVGDIEGGGYTTDREANLSLVTGRGGTGQALRSGYTVASSGEGGGFARYLDGALGSGEYQNIVVSWWERYTAGTDLTQGGPSEGPKHFMAFREISGTYPYRITCGVSATNMTNAQNGAKVGTEFHIRDNDQVRLNGEIAWHQLTKVPRFDTLNDGSWFRITYHLFNNNGATQFAIWLNGTNVLPLTTATAAGSMGWRMLAWFDVIPGGIGDVQYEFDHDIDDLTIWVPG